MKRGTVALALLLTALAGAPAAAQGDLTPAQQRLADQARYWQARERTELAIDAWSRLLDSSPNNRDALYNLGILEVSRGRIFAAQQYLARLKTAAPDDPTAADLAQIIQRGPIDPAIIERARHFAQQGDVDRGIDLYRSAFAGARPPENLALEYYQTLAGTKTGWAEAKAGLERLAAETPGDQRTQLALAQVLSYQEATRRDGIARLSALSRDQSVARPATAAWRQALLWLAADKNDVPLYHDYLARNGADEAITRKQAQILNPAADLDPRSRARRDAFSELEHGDSRTAEAKFEQLLRTQPNDPDALGGLGIIRLKEGRFAEAWALLDKASRVAPDRAGQWQDALRSAAYWSLVNDAKTDRGAGRLAEAQVRAQQAVPFAPATDVSALLILGDTLAAENRPANAEAVYRRILQVQPSSIDGLNGLLTALRRQGKTAEAQKLLASLPSNVIAKLPASRGTIASQYRAEALAAMRRGDDEHARRDFDRAIAADPADPWARLDYARFLEARGQDYQARMLIEASLRSRPSAATLQAAATFYDGLGETDRALALLQRIPASGKPAAARSLERSLLGRRQADEAVRLARSGDVPGARQILQRATAGANDIDTIATIATAYAEIGDRSQALQLGRARLASAATTSPHAALQYASILLRAGLQTEAAGQIAQAEQMPDLSDVDRRSLATLRAGLAVREADTARTSGRLADAYDRLAPQLAASPDNPALMLALARLYEAGKRPQQALSTYDSVLARDPNNQEALGGLVRSAIAVKNYKLAANRLQEALAARPNDPQLYLLKAQLYRAHGDYDRAIATLKQARAMMGDGAAASSTNSDVSAPIAPPASPHVPGNPFAPRSSADEGLRPSYVLDVGAPTGADVRLTQSASAAAAPGPQLASLETGDDPISQQLAQLPDTAPPTPATTSAPTPLNPMLRPLPMAAPTAPTAAAPGTQSSTPSGTINNTFGLAPVPMPPPPPLPAFDAVPPTAPPQPAAAPLTAPPAAPELPAYTPPPPAPPPVKTSVPRRRARPPAPVEASEPSPPATFVGPVLPPAPALRLEPAEPTLAQSLESLPPADNSLASDINRELGDLETEHDPEAQPNAYLRHRDGENGLSMLDELGAGAKMSVPLGRGRAGVSVTAVNLDSGMLGSDIYTMRRFGTNATVPLAGMAAPNSGQQTGAALNANYALANFKADIGTTPIGFVTRNIVGGVAWNPSFVNNTVFLNLEGNRRPVTDSLLSYAGLRDARTGLAFGGVISTGGKATLVRDDGYFGLYGSAGYNVLDGTNVESNSERQFGLGAFVRPYKTDTETLKVGVDLSTMFYDKNLSFFTLGHGGYFSPQRFFALSAPIEYSVKEGRLTYTLNGAIGMQSITQNSVPYFPTLPGLQAAAAAQANGDPTLPVVYAAQNSTGLGYNAAARAEYELTPTLWVGGRLSVDNARYYNEQVGMIYLRQLLGSN